MAINLNSFILYSSVYVAIINVCVRVLVMFDTLHTVDSGQ